MTRTSIQPSAWVGDLSKPPATSNLEAGALKHPPKKTPAAALALIFCPARTGLHHGLIAEVTRGPGASGVASIKQIAMSLYSLCSALGEQGQRETQRAGGHSSWLHHWTNKYTHITTYSNVTKQLITENN